VVRKGGKRVIIPLERSSEIGERVTTGPIFFGAAEGPDGWLRPDRRKRLARRAGLTKQIATPGMDIARSRRKLGTTRRRSPLSI
jgi:hypothetical protein